MAGPLDLGSEEEASSSTTGPVATSTAACIASSSAGAERPRPQPSRVKKVRFADEWDRHMTVLPSATAQQLKYLAWGGELRATIALAGGADPQLRQEALLRILEGTRAGRRFTLDRMRNDTAATGCSLVLPSGQLHLLNSVCWDTGATTSLVDAQTARDMGWQYHPTGISLVLADAGAGQVVGITEPAFAVLAAGTYDETKVMIQALVVENVGSLFKLLCGKDLAHRLNAYVIPQQQRLSFVAAHGKRGSVPMICYFQPTPETVALGWDQAPPPELCNLNIEHACVAVPQLSAALPLLESGGGCPCTSTWEPLGCETSLPASKLGGSSSCCERPVSSSLPASLPQSFSLPLPVDPQPLLQVRLVPRPDGYVAVSLDPAAVASGAPAGVAAALAHSPPVLDNVPMASPVPPVLPQAPKQPGHCRPDVYQRCLLWLSTVLVILVLGLQATVRELLEWGFALPLDAARAALARSQHSTPAKPPQPHRISPRSRKKSYRSWAVGLQKRLWARLPPTASQQRQWSRWIAFWDANDAHQGYKALAHTVQHSSRWFAWIIVVCCLCVFLTPTLATPDALLGIQAATGNLALWELSHVAGWKFLCRRTTRALAAYRFPGFTSAPPPWAYSAWPHRDCSYCRWVIPILSRVR